MKLLKLIPLLCAVCVICSSCAWPKNPPKNSPQEEDYYDSGLYADTFSHRLQYLQLSSDEQRCYGEIYTAVFESAQSDSYITASDGSNQPGIRIPLSESGLTEQQMSRIFEAFFRDNPQFFFLDRTYSVSGESTDDGVIYNVFLLQYTMDKSQRTAAINRLENAVTALLSDLPASEDDYVLEKALHDRLLTHCSYDETAATATSSGHANAYSAYGALVDGHAVCEGYAKAMQLLLEQVGISSTVILGRSASDGEAHMWNLVNVNGAYYYLDPTWNDKDNGPHYAYFNMTSRQLQRSHMLDAGQLVHVDCTAETDNYFRRCNTYIDTFEREVIAQTIARRVQSGDTTIHLQFSDGKFENGLLFLKNISLTQKWVNPYLDVGSLWDYELYSQPNQNTLSLYKSDR